MATTLPLRAFRPPQSAPPTDQWPVAASVLFQATACAAFWASLLTLLG